MAYTSHMNDPQHPSSLSFCLFGDDLGCDWEELCYQEKTLTSMSSNSKTKMIGLQPVTARQIQTLASLESNYETSEDDECLEKEVEEIVKVGEESADEDELEDDFDAEDDCDDDDDDYVDFCNLLAKSPACDAAASRFIHTSFVTSSFSFSVTNDDDDSGSEDDDDAGDNGEGASENESDEDEFGWSAPQTMYFGGFDPFAVSGLFMPSLLSAIASCAPPVSDEKSCSSECNSDDHYDGNEDYHYDDNEDDGKELAEKMKDINRRWLETYSNSNDDNSTLVDADSCINSPAVKVACKKNVHFCDKMNFIDILNSEEWAEDYEGARKGPWEQYHRDQLRFENRIESISELLSEVLAAEHRATVFRKLYETADLVTDSQDSMSDLFQALPASS